MPLNKTHVLPLWLFAFVPPDLQFVLLGAPAQRGYLQCQPRTMDAVLIVDPVTRDEPENWRQC
jgi:hypothetical protein